MIGGTQGRLVRLKQGAAAEILSWITIVSMTAAGIFLSAPAVALAESPPFTSPLYLRITTSTSIGANSDQLSGTAGTVENTATRVNCAATTTEWQFRPGGATGTTTITDGYGWIYEQPLAGQYANAAWNFSVRLKKGSSGSTFIGTVRAYVHRYSGGGSGTYTNLFTATRASTTLTTTMSTFTFTATPGAQDMQGQYLYVNYTWQTTSGGASGQTVWFGDDISTSSITPPSSSIPTLGGLLLTVAVASFIAVLVRRKVLTLRKAEA
jgi:hypothetical protein